jgi:hypothetical protein
MIPDQETNVGEAITVTGVITDPGWLDSQTVVIAWGDGLTSTLSLTATEREFSATHTYAVSGNYTATVVATDKDGGSDQAEFNVSVFTRWYLPLIRK